MVIRTDVIGNVATVFIPENAKLTVKGQSNSDNTQRITINNQSGVTLCFTGSGRNNTVIGEEQLKVEGVPIVVTFEYDNGGTWLPSSLVSAPNVDGRSGLNILQIVSQNQLNAGPDCAVLFRWFN